MLEIQSLEASLEMKEAIKELAFGKWKEVKNLKTRRNIVHR